MHNLRINPYLCSNKNTYITKSYEKDDSFCTHGLCPDGRERTRLLIDGRRTERPVNGVFIKNGKKVVR